MATRTISTRLAIEGEAEYKQSVGNINSALGALKSELTRVKAEFSNNANSMDALRAKGEALNRIQETQAEKVKAAAAALENARKAQQEYAAKVEACQARVTAAQAALAKMEGGTATAAQAQKKLTAELEQYQKELAGAERYNEAAQRGVYNWEKQLASAQTAVIRTNHEIERNGQHMDEAKKSADGCATSIDQYGKRVKQSGEQSRGATEAVGALAAALAAGGLKMAFDETAAAIQACINASISFESAIAGVYKTVEGTDAQLAAISDGIRQMATEIPAGTTQIAAVAEAAGQLGIATEDVLSFARVMLDLGESTNLSAEAAAAALAKFANITNMSAENYERLGSVIVGLGNNFATTEADIVEMGTRLAATGALTGLTEAQIMALAAAMSSLGIEAEAGGSSISKLLKQFEVMVATGSSDLDRFAQVAGMSAQQFAQAWRRDAVSALSAFIDGLGRVDAAGGSSVAVLEELGITETRMSNAVLAMASSQGVLEAAVEQANAAWEENTALADEASKRYATTESQLAMMRNAFDNVQTAIGDVLNPALREMAEAGTGAFNWAAEFVEENPLVVSAIGAVAATLGALTVAVTGFSVSVQVVKPLWDAFDTALTNSKVGLAITGVALLASAVGTFIALLPKASQETEGFNQKLAESRKAYEETAAAIQVQKADTLDMVAALESLAGVENKTAAQKETLLSLVEQLNGAVPELSLAYDAQADSLNLTTQAVRELALAQAEQEERAAAVERMSQLYVEQADRVAQLQENLEALAQAERDQREAEEAYAAGADVTAATLGEYGRTIHDLKQKIAELDAALAGNAKEQKELEDQYNSVRESAEDAGEAAEDFAEQTNYVSTKVEEAASALEAATEATEKETEATKTLISTTDKLSAAMEEQRKNGELSVDTAMDLIDAGYAAVLAIDEETGAVKLNREAYLEITQAKLEDQLAALEVQKASINTALDLQSEAEAALNAAGAYLRLTSAKQQSAWMGDNSQSGKRELESQLASIETQIAILEKLKNGLGTVSTPKSSGSSRSSSKEKTQAQLELEAYKEAVEELDHLRAMDEISQEEYYRRKTELGDRYLTQNKQARQALDEELHDWQKGAYDREAATLASALEKKQITLQEYLDGMKRAQQTYLKENTQAWADAEEEQLRESRKRKEDAYDGQLADLKYFLNMDLISEAEYYQEMARLRDEFLEENSEKWRAAMVAEHEYLEQCREAELKAAQAAYEAQLAALEKWLKEEQSALKEWMDQERSELKEWYQERQSELKSAYQAEKEETKKRYQDKKTQLKAQYQEEKAQKKAQYQERKTALKDQLTAQKNAAKEAYQAKKEAIQAELALEKERLNAILDGIDREIQARKELREDEDLDGAIAKAQKRLDAARAELTFARTDEDRASWEKEIVRRRQELDQAVQNKEDTEFYRQKELEKAAVRDQLDQAQSAASEKLDGIEREYSAETERIQASYDAALAALESKYAGDTAALESWYSGETSQLEAWYETERAKLEADYAASNSQLEGEYKRKVEALERDYAGRLKSLEDRYQNRVDGLDQGGGRGGGGSSGQKEYSDEVKQLSKELGIDLGFAQLQYDHGARPKGEYDGGTSEVKKIAASAAAAVASAVGGIVGVVNNPISAVTRNNSASVVINQASSLTEGQIGRAVEKALEKLGR